MSATRGNRHPPAVGATNIALISDVHIGGYLSQSHHPYKMRADLNVMVGAASVQAWIFTGDLTDLATNAEYTELGTWFDGLDTRGKPRAIVPGNHDLIGGAAGGGVPDVVTPDGFATRLASRGVEGRNYVVDVGADLRILCVFPMDNTLTGAVNAWRMTIDAPTLEWCDARLGETDRRCIIAFHAPLRNTVGTTPRLATYSSADDPWCAHSQDAYTIEQMLAGHTNVIAWVSGHTHTAPSVADAVKSVNYSGSPLAAISASAPHVLPPTSTPRMVSALLSVYPNRVEVRYRDHGAGQWLAPVRTVNL